MADGELKKAVESSIKAGIKCGRIDEKMQAAPIAMLRFMADLLDADGGNSSIMRYVSPASFLSYCKELGFLPEISETKNKAQAEVVQLVGASKWKRA